MEISFQWIVNTLARISALQQTFIIINKKHITSFRPEKKKILFYLISGQTCPPLCHYDLANVV